MLLQHIQAVRAGDTAQPPSRQFGTCSSWLAGWQRLYVCAWRVYVCVCTECVESVSPGGVANSCTAAADGQSLCTGDRPSVGCMLPLLPSSSRGCVCPCLSVCGVSLPVCVRCVHDCLPVCTVCPSHTLSLTPAGVRPAPQHDPWGCGGGHHNSRGGRRNIRGNHQGGSTERSTAQRSGRLPSAGWMLWLYMCADASAGGSGVSKGVVAAPSVCCTGSHHQAQ